MKTAFLSGKINQFVRICWAATLLSLPVTSFRYFPGLGETTYVRPLAFYPLILLLPILLIQLIRKKISSHWPGSLILLGMFLLILLATSILGVLNAPLDLRGQTYWARAIRAWASVLIGFAFFISALLMNRDYDNLRFSLRWLMAGFFLDILWGAVQAITFYTPLLDKTVVTHWQLAFSMRELVKTNRVSGLAYEPAWLAGQIATVYLPWLFAAVVTKTHLTRYKWLEGALLGVSGLLLLSTYSRGGILTAFGAAFLTFLFVGGNQVRSSWRWFISGFMRERQQMKQWLIGTSARLGMIIILVSVVSGSIILLGQKNYIARLWNTRSESLSEFIVENSAGARAAYAWGALSTFNEHPWIGVGLGASGFYIYEYLPDWALTTVPEIARQLSPTNRLYPNPKNMFIRVLAETGLVGFSLFLAFLFGLLGDTLSFLRKPGPLRFVGVAGLFSWLAIAFYNLTQDSFATPNIWINFGLLVGMSQLTIQKEDSLEEGP